MARVRRERASGCPAGNGPLIDLAANLAGSIPEAGGGLLVARSGFARRLPLPTPNHASPMTYQEGIVFHPTASVALSVKQRSANGRCVAANRAATSAGSADANTVPKYLELTYRSASLPLDAVKGTAIVKSDGGGGALSSSE
jgi:hypothetical protein